jgi:hypothetical protein
MRWTILLMAALAGQEGAPERLKPEKEGEGLAAKYPGDAGLAKDPAVVLVEDFESGELKAWTETKAPEIVEEAHSGRKGLKFTATLGGATGGHLWKMLKPGHATLHLRFYVKFPEDHSYVHHFVHLCGYNPPTAWPQGGAGERPAGDKRFSTGVEPWGHWGKQGPPGAWHLYTYWQEMKKAPDGRYWGNHFEPEKPAAAERGKWTCVEVMIKCNTVGKADGEQAFWIDGACAGRWGGIRWRSSDDLLVNGVWILYYITENAAKQNGVKDPPKTSSVLFDDIVVATAYIGPRKR